MLQLEGGGMSAAFQTLAYYSLFCDFGGPLFAAAGQADVALIGTRGACWRVA